MVRINWNEYHKVGVFVSEYKLNNEIEEYTRKGIIAIGRLARTPSGKTVYQLLVKNPIKVEEKPVIKTPKKRTTGGSGKVSKFERDSPFVRGTYRCKKCGKTTRETGMSESQFHYCADCLQKEIIEYMKEQEGN
jgi:ribosomal protein S14